MSLLCRRRRSDFPLWLLLATAFASQAVGGVATSAPLDDAVERYRADLIEDIGSALAGARRLHQCIVADDIGGAKQSWIDARAGWERSEVFTAGFVPQLDKDIDAWPEAPSGFHAIEAKLFGANRTDVEAETQSLVQSLAELDVTVRTIPLNAQGLLNGMAQLAYELGESKVDGGESRVSGTSLADMRNNIFGIARAYHTIVAAAIEAADPALAAAAVRQIESLEALLAASDLKRADSDRLRTLSEELVVTLQSAAPGIGLQKPALESSAQ
jgi:iron uptake system component EfeO